MFEQSTLTSPPASKRLWATCVGISGQMALVGGAMLAPILWPQILPPATLMTSLVAPGPPPAPPGPVVQQKAVQATTRRAAVLNPNAFTAPLRVPQHAEILVDPPPEIAALGVPGSVGPGTPGGAEDGILGGLMRAAGAPTPALPHVAAAPVETPAAAPEPKRVRVGGLVKMATLLHRVEPVYPALAKAARVSGTVELRGVIGTDGRLREVTLISGHPLLARAAIDAVSQWVYAPTQLNNEPVEVVAPITVTFRLN